MNNALSTSSAQHILAHARRARAAYDDAVNSDGVSSSAWSSIAHALRQTGQAMWPLVCNPECPAITHDVVQCQLDRARDAEHRSDYAHRMVEVAKTASQRLQWIPAVAVEVAL